jgi:hypothetical protein
VTAFPADPTGVASLLGDRLDVEGIDYAIGGAVALGAHGVPRTTADADLSVFVPEPELGRLFDALERAGCLFERETAAREVERRAFFSVRCGRIGVDLFVSFHPHHHESHRRRVRFADPDGRERWYLSAEDLVVHKLALFRLKDRADLEALFALRGDELDLGYVRRWIHAIVPPGDPRRAELEALATRFRAPAP